MEKLGQIVSRDREAILSRHHPRRQVIQYSRDVNDRVDKPRRTGYPACAGYDDLVHSSALEAFTTRPLADHPRNHAALIPPPRDPNGLRIVKLYPLFSPICCQNRLETLRTSDVGTIDRR